MGALLAAPRSALALLAVLLWLGIPGSLYLYLFVMPAVWIRPRSRAAVISRYIRHMTAGILALLQAGGARLTRSGRLPTEGPILVVMNHQSLVDILIVTMLASPYVPVFVTRRRYARFVPLVSPSVRLHGCPIVDPKRDAKGALDAIVRGARTQEHGLLIFPEGHRSLDGDVRPFRPAGLTGALEARRTPVYLVVTDGFWTCRRLADFVFKIHKIQGETEVLGPFEPPEAEAEIPAFIMRLHETLVSHLRLMRERRHGAV